MIETIRCRFCGDELDLCQQFAYLVELQTVNNPVMLRAIRRLPHAGGVPLRCCKVCQSGIEQKRFVVRDLNAGTRRAARRGGHLLMLTAFAVGLGLLTASVFTPPH
jgi:hypothetical protein